MTAGAFHNGAGYWSCYSRTPEGALYAAYNATQYCADPNLAARALPQTLADGPGKAAATSAARRNDAPCSPLSPAGFVMQSYDGTNATVYLLVTTATGALGAAGTNLVWQHGDWKIKVDASGHNPIAAVPAMAAADNTPWGANG
ncbi:hypothetical protein [Curtobacterium sp. B8]|uniref:hypothetical protein n=1 Tax=Curtobacterium sp. B8 TaxID=95611 RepID=UPI0011D278AD|nr:hypothetical protein [Curtobacterium sp. B8]